MPALGLSLAVTAMLGGGSAVAPDIIAPTISNLVISGTTTTGCRISFDTDEVGGTGYAVIVADGAAAPSAAQIIAGTNASGAPATWAGSVSVSSIPSAEVGSMALSGATAYDVYVAHQDAAANISNVLAGGFTTVASGTPPVLSGFTATPGSDIEADLSVATDTASEGTLYWVIVPTAAAAPSAAQIKSGQNGSGGAATFSGSTTVGASGAEIKMGTGLSAATVYDAYATQEITAGFSNVVTAEFTTDTLVLAVAINGTATGMSAGSSVFGTAQTDYLGGANAISWTDNNAGGTGNVTAVTNTLSFFNGINKFSLKMKRVSGGPWMRIRPQNVTIGSEAWFDLQNSAIGTEGWIGTPTIRSIGNSWLQLRGSLDMTGADVSGIFTLWMGDNNGDVIVSLNGTNVYHIHDLRITRVT